MKVLMITPAYFPNIAGGGDISCHLLARELKRYVDVVVISFDGDKIQQTDVEGVMVRRIKPVSRSKILLNIQAYHFLRKEIKNYDIFHTYNMFLLPAVGKLTKDYDINSVATLNGIIFSPSMSNYMMKLLSPKFYRNKIAMKFIKNIKRFTTICPYYKENWIRDGIDSSNIAVIPNMIDRNFTPPGRKTKNADIELLFIGNYAKWRKLEILLEAYSKLEYDKGVELVVVGKGWASLINKFQLKNRSKNKITYLNNIPYHEIPSIYASADIFAYPTARPVPIGRVLIESLQSELTVVTTGNDHYSPIIRNKKDGILIYPMSTNTLAESLQQLIDNPKWRKELAKSGKKRVYEVCSPDKIVKQYIKIYESIVK